MYLYINLTFDVFLVNLIVIFILKVIAFNQQKIKINNY